MTFAWPKKVGKDFKRNKPLIIHCSDRMARYGKPTGDDDFHRNPHKEVWLGDGRNDSTEDDG